MPASLHRSLLALLVVVEIALIAASLSLLADSAGARPAPLESRPLVTPDTAVVHRSDVLDTINLFSGGDTVGRDDLAREDDPRNLSYRRHLTPDSGHFSWDLIRDVPGDDALLMQLASTAGGGSREAKRLRDGARAGLLNFFYDLGGSRDAFVHNWSTVGVQELQMSPLLPWQKYVDFVILSSYDAQHCGALGYILEGNPRTIVLGPTLPAPSASNGDIRSQLEAAAGFHPLGAGLHRLTPRLAAFVYHRDSQQDTALALVISVHEGVVVQAAAAGDAPTDLVLAVERAVAKPVLAFVGATGFERGVEDEAGTRKMQALQRSHPALVMVPTFRTTLEELNGLQEIFGTDHVRRALLGTRLLLSSF